MIRLAIAGMAAAACADPGDGSRRIELETPPLEVAAGEDVTYCTYVDTEVEEDLDILTFEGKQSQFGHHTILYGVRSRQPAGTHPCTEADMINVRYLAAGGSETGAQEVPDGIAFRLRAGQQLMIQSHFINASDQATTARSWFTVDAAPPDPARQPADLFTVVTTDIEVQARSRGQAVAECEVPRDLQLIALGGHAHEWGRQVAITRTPAGGSPEMLYDQPWSAERMFDPVIDHFTPDKPLLFRAGDRIRVDCAYENDTDEPLAFPTEMCVAFAFYFPGDREIDCVDGNWPGS